MTSSNPRYTDYITDAELKAASVRDRIEMIHAIEKSRENDLEDERLKNDKKYSKWRIVSYSLATVIASVIGAGTLVYTQVINNNKRIVGNGETTVELLLRLENMERTTIDILKIVRADHTFARDVKFEINKIYCNYYPQQCKNEYGFNIRKRVNR